MTTKIFQIDGLPNFLRYGAPLARLQRAGVPLLTVNEKLNLKNVTATALSLVVYL